MPQQFDKIISHIADYVAAETIDSREAYETARLVLADSLGCAFLAYEVPECRALLGPLVPEHSVTAGSLVPGQRELLDPITASFNLGMLIRWLDYNDTWLAAEWGHPSDNIGALLSVADYLARGGTAGRRAESTGHGAQAASTGRDRTSTVGGTSGGSAIPGAANPGRAAEPHAANADAGGSSVGAAGSSGAASVARSTAPTVQELLTAIIKAHEIQGVLALENSLNRAGFDHVLFVKVASAAVSAKLLGATRDEIAAVVSHAFIDAGPLRTYRHAPNTGPRKSWAAGDAAARGVTLALLVLRGEPGYRSALTAPTWGFSDALLQGKEITLPCPLGSYVMENILFKVSFPAEFHGQTAVEAALHLHPEAADRLDEIDRIVIRTQESAMRIIDKRGPLHNPADRDHCIQYMTAVALIYGELRAEHYRDETAADPRIDRLRELTTVEEEPDFSRDYLDPEKRSIGNAVQVFFTDGSKTAEARVEYPIGHRRRREEAKPLLREKLRTNLKSFYGAERSNELVMLLLDDDALSTRFVSELTERFRPHR